MNIRKSGQLLALAGLLGGGFVPSEARASVITGISSTSLPGGSTGSIGPVGGAPAAPNNDNAAGPSPNVVPYNIFFNDPGTLEIEFTAANSGGTTEYRFAQTFINNTGETWNSFRFELGFGTGDDFVRAGALSFLDFDSPDFDPAPFSNAFAGLDNLGDVLEWHSGSVASIGVAIFTFAIDLPDNLAQWHPGGLSRFTLRQTGSASSVPPPAAVPEPTSMILLGSGLLGLAAKVRSRRRV